MQAIKALTMINDGRIDELIAFKIIVKLDDILEGENNV